MHRYTPYIQLYLRLALGLDFFILGLDRLGAWGPYGSSPNISWGDWRHFVTYARQVMSFLPEKAAHVLAVLATIGEIGFGLLLVIGWYTRQAAIGSGLMAFCFAVSMWISFGYASPIGYSVFVVSAGSLLLAVQPSYRWSIDHWRAQRS